MGGWVCEVLPQRKKKRGAEKVFAMLKGGGGTHSLGVFFTQ